MGVFDWVRTDVLGRAIGYLRQGTALTDSIYHMFCHLLSDNFDIRVAFVILKLALRGFGIFFAILT